MPVTDELAGQDGANLVPGFYTLTTSLAERAAELSTVAPVVFAHIDFFGGTGLNEVIGWRDGDLALGPLFTCNHPAEAEHDRYIVVTHTTDMAVNVGLRFLGVRADESTDEFATVGLKRWRSISDVLASRLPDPTPE